MRPYIPYIFAAVVSVAMFFFGRQTAPRTDPNIDLKKTIAVLEDQNRQYKAKAIASTQNAEYWKMQAEITENTRPKTKIIYHEAAVRVFDVPAMQQYNILSNQLVRLDSVVASGN